MRRTSSEALPKVNLMAVVTLSGVSAEPILTFPNKTAAPADFNQWGKTSMHPAQSSGQDMMPPEQQAMPSQADNLHQVAENLARDTSNEQNTERAEDLARDIGPDSAQDHSQTMDRDDRQPQPEQEKEYEHER